MEKENVINKIRKLLRLQYGAEKIGSMGEAYAAAKMIRKLLTEYNLSLGDIGQDAGEGETIKMGEDAIPYADKYGANWKRDLLGVICNYNYCKMWVRGDKKMLIVGAEHNVAVCREFFVYLCQVFRRLAMERLNDRVNELMKRRVRMMEKDKELYVRSYMEGVPFGLEENYKEHQQTSAETALVLSHSRLIEDYMTQSRYRNTGKTHKAKRPELYREAVEEGIEDGRNVSLNKELDKKQGKVE